METQTKQKLCWNCEARVEYGVENCPSCGVYLSTSPILEQSTNVNTNYINPPYRLAEEEQETNTIIPSSPYSFTGYETHKEELEPITTENTPPPATSNLLKGDILSLGFLLSGTIFFFFGIMLLFFSEGGRFTLSWSSEYWYLYAVAAIPLLMMGWRALPVNDKV